MDLNEAVWLQYTRVSQSKWGDEEQLQMDIAFAESMMGVGAYHIRFPIIMEIWSYIYIKLFQ